MEVAQEIFNIDSFVAMTFIWFLWLWHKRTVARDAQFFQTMQQMIALLSDCQEGLHDAPTPRN